MTNEYSIVYVSDTIEIARRRADTFIHMLRDNGMHFSLKLRNPIEITVGFQHIYFMGDITFRKWCMGRTYINGDDGTLCHSGYPVGKKDT